MHYEMLFVGIDFVLIGVLNFEQSSNQLETQIKILADDL